ncbi:hypothetical protein COU88_05015 [Candidatus Roizmanbacteria bacterium CG10_big_fil_rev_8_21_14_0_10_39_6]|uniref:ABC transporter permease n=1 Tax=Candidatus Roizmanbacteria bacterium CG10_big_fil_rev_8_21_14_0_10_39_6 TaxID=1974853 RepID=A0A2M8KR96_9BACT|nr:MAG: hypothetical protein COU88_05015 [Candidatus Roizmanbacteria bacterium CG10_big_fil_rev_8_21_14_0_10_39_6]
MKHTLSLLKLFSYYSIKKTLAQPLSVFLFVVAKIIRFALFFFFIHYLLSKTRMLVGYTLTETLLFFLTFSLIDGIAQLLFREVYRFRPLVTEGTLDLVLTKPYHPFLQILIGGIDILDVVMVCIYGVFALYFLRQIDSSYSLSLVVYILLIVNALIIAAAAHICILALGLISSEIDNALSLFRDITRLGSLPIDIYSEPIRTILNTVVPVGVMMSFPVKGYLGLLSIQSLVYSLLLGTVLLWTSLYMWRRALVHYQSWGG